MNFKKMKGNCNNLKNAFMVQCFPVYFVRNALKDKEEHCTNNEFICHGSSKDDTIGLAKSVKNEIEGLLSAERAYENQHITTGTHGNSNTPANATGYAPLPGTPQPILDMLQ